MLNPKEHLDAVAEMRVRLVELCQAMGWNLVVTKDSFLIRVRERVWRVSQPLAGERQWFANWLCVGAEGSFVGGGPQEVLNRLYEEVAVDERFDASDELRGTPVIFAQVEAALMHLGWEAWRVAAGVMRVTTPYAQWQVVSRSVSRSPCLSVHMCDSESTASEEPALNLVGSDGRPHEKSAEAIIGFLVCETLRRGVKVA
ncbi:MAG: hypothetical protein AAGJ40_22025 [Planctomycetota bacterium]